MIPTHLWYATFTNRYGITATAIAHSVESVRSMLLSSIDSWSDQPTEKNPITFVEYVKK